MNENSAPKQIKDNIYVFPIVLPDNPLKWLNCYAIKGRAGERSLLIDSGFNRLKALGTVEAAVLRNGIART